MLTFTDQAGCLVVMAIEYADPSDAELMRSRCAPPDLARLNRSLDALAGREARLRGMASAEQQAIGWGGYFARPWADDDALATAVRFTIAQGGGIPDDPPPACTGYGRIFTRPEYRLSERAAGSAPAELRSQVARADAAFERGWRHGRVYSRTQPRGVPIDTHVALMIPITAWQFGQARKLHWPDDIPQPPRN